MCRSWIGAAAALLVVATVQAGEPADLPVASFASADGFVDLALARAGQPVPGARVTVLVRSDAWSRADAWAGGATDVGGRWRFPRPPGADCQVVFDVGAGPTAPIPLALLPDGAVIPLSAPVRDGTAECCRPVDPAPVAAPSQEPARPVALWHRLLFGAVVLAVNGLVMGWAWRRGRDRTRSKT